MIGVYCTVHYDSAAVLPARACCLVLSALFAACLTVCCLQRACFSRAVRARLPAPLLHIFARLRSSCLRCALGLLLPTVWLAFVCSYRAVPKSASLTCITQVSGTSDQVMAAVRLITEKLRAVLGLGGTAGGGDRDRGGGMDRQQPWGDNKRQRGPEPDDRRRGGPGRQ
jgi:hypothetical protein